MTNEEFETVLGERIEKIKKVLSHKASEYATRQDRMHNFNRAARLLGTTPEKALVGMLSKHIVSVLDMVDSEAVCPHGLIDEKIGDTINYLILLEALLKRRN